MHIFVSNLPSSVARRRSITAQLDRLGLAYEMPPAVVGKDLTHAEIEQHCDAAALKANPWITRGAIGCTMTNQSIYRQIVERGLPCALYLEDDTILSDALPSLLQQIEEQIRDGEVVLLYYVGHQTIRLSARQSADLGDGYSLRHPVDASILGSSAAVVVTALAARRMLEANTPIHMTPDCWSNFCDQSAISVRCVDPMPVDSSDHKSTVGYLDSRPLLDALSCAIESLRPPLVYSLLLAWRKQRRRRRQRCIVVDEFASRSVSLTAGDPQDDRAADCGFASQIVGHHVEVKESGRRSPEPCRVM